MGKAPNGSGYLPTGGLLGKGWELAQYSQPFHRELKDHVAQ